MGKRFKHTPQEQENIQMINNGSLPYFQELGSKQDIIEQAFYDMPHALVKGKRYHSPLPSELQEWYCYTIDGGHSIMSIMKVHENEAFSTTDTFKYLVAVTVKSVLAGYEIKKGIVIVDLEYDECGVVEDDENFEF